MSVTEVLDIAEVTRWVESIDEATVDDVLSALQHRHEVLQAGRAQQAKVGRHVVVEDVDPRDLEGLEGVIEESDGETVSIRLSPSSTGALRFSAQRRYSVGPGMRFLLEGVPASCCHRPSEAVSA